MDTTPHFGFDLLAPSQEQPEVPINANTHKLDDLLFELAGTILVEQAGDSPGFTAHKLIFEGSAVTVTAETNETARVHIEGSGGSGTGGGAQEIYLQLACSDLATALATGTSVAYVRAPAAFTLTHVRASLLTASSSGAVSIDIKKNGSTVLSTALSIDASENTSLTAATAAVIWTSAIGDDDAISIDITGAGTGAKGLIVTLIGAA